MGRAVKGKVAIIIEDSGVLNPVWGGASRLAGKPPRVPTPLLSEFKVR